MDADKKKLQKLIDRIAKDSRDAHVLAQRLYGPSTQLFAESAGGLFVISDDTDGPSRDRQSFIEQEAAGIHQLGVGAW